MKLSRPVPSDDGVVRVRFEIQWSSVLEWRAKILYCVNLNPWRQPSSLLGSRCGSQIAIP